MGSFEVKKAWNGYDFTDLSFSSNFEKRETEIALAFEAVRLPATLPTTLAVAWVCKSETPVVDPIAAVVGLSSLAPFCCCKLRLDETPCNLGCMVVDEEAVGGQFLLIVLILYCLMRCCAGKMPLCSVLATSRNIPRLYA